VLEKPFFSDYFSHAKRLREIFCNKLVRIRAIQIPADKVFPQTVLLPFVHLGFEELFKPRQRNRSLSANIF